MTGLVVGFTGTRKGMTAKQFGQLIDVLDNYQITEFHHGDCVGADSGAVRMVRRYPHIRVHSHPCTISSQRAYVASDVVYDVKPPLDRNHDIVDACNLLLVAPKTATEELRSGTWATYRYALKVGKPTRILEP